jgi:dipeptidase D
VETDGALALALDETEATAAAGPDVTARVVGLLASVPAGVIALSESAPGTVETSTSPNVVRTEDGAVTLASMARSSSAAGLDDVVAALAEAARAHGAEIEVRRSYPPWEPDLRSRLLATARATFERLFGELPRLEIVHGGLECAVLGAKLAGVDMISLGPRVEGPHAPGERVSVASTERCYRLLGAVLDDVSRGGTPA